MTAAIQAAAAARPDRATVAAPHRNVSFAFGALLLLFVAYCTYFIYRTSFVIDGVRYFVLFDDAMLSMRYAKNLAAGNGLVWNPGGEQVEGFSSLLGTLYMAFWHLFPIPIAKLSAIVQFSSLAALLGNLFAVRAIARRVTGSEGAAAAAVGLTALYFPLNNWALQGLEVGVLALWVSLCVWLLLRSQEDRRAFLLLCLLLGCGTLLRYDAVVMALPMALMGAWTRKNRSASLGLALVFVAGFVLLQAAWRVLYFGDGLPNIYQVMAGYPLRWRLERGLRMFLEFATATRWLVFLPMLLFILRRDKETFVVFTPCVTQVLYSLFVGGDAWEWYGGANRFIAPVMPQFMVLLCMFFVALRLNVARRWQMQRRPRQSNRLLPRVAALAAFLVAFGLLNQHAGLRQSVERWTLRQRPLNVNANRQFIKLAHELKRATAPEATLAVVWSGSLPYFAERQCVDLLGKTDKTVARGAARIEPHSDSHQQLAPGYGKWDYDYSLGRLHPDVIVDTWYGMEAHPAWAAYYGHELGSCGSVYVRDGSPHLRLPAPELRASRDWWQGLWLEQRGERDGALEKFAHAIATGPYNEAWRYHFGGLLVEQRDVSAVEAYYDSTAQQDEKPQTSHFFRGVALARAGRLQEAVEWFRKALDVDPAHEMSHEMWGDVLVAQGRLAEATLHYQAALRILPEYRSARLRLADTLDRLGRQGEAQRERAMADSQPELTDARRFYSWGKFLLELGRVEAAIVELERANEVDPDNRDVNRLLQHARRLRHQGE